MGRFATVFALCVAMLLLSACSSGSASPELRLDTGSFSEDELLMQIRQNVMAQSRMMLRLCQDLSELADADAVETFTAANYMANRTPIASPVPADEARAASILRGECKRLMG